MIPPLESPLLLPVLFFSSPTVFFFAAADFSDEALDVGVLEDDDEADDLDEIVDGGGEGGIGE